MSCCASLYPCCTLQCSLLPYLHVSPKLDFLSYKGLVSIASQWQALALRPTAQEKSASK